MNIHNEWVRCCEATNDNLIYLGLDNEFHMSDNDHRINYCPWCGKLLDINLLEK